MTFLCIHICIISHNLFYCPISLPGGPIDVALNLLSSSDEKKDDNNNNIPPLKMEKYITKTFPLSKVREALEFAALKSTMKVQLVMTEDE